MQGVPSVLLGLVAPAVLTDRPEQARWLTLTLTLTLMLTLTLTLTPTLTLNPSRRDGSP